MKKKSKIHFAVIIVAALVAGLVQTAQSAVPFNVISSPAALEAWAHEHTSQGYISVYLQGEITDNGYRHESGGTSDEILHRLTAKDFNMQATGIQAGETVGVYVALFDEDWNTMFSSEYVRTPLEKTGGSGWSFGQLELQMKRAEYMPVQYPEGVSNPDSVELRLTDEYGNVSGTERFWDYDGASFMFATKYSGFTGQLVFTKEGEKTVYDLKTGQQVTVQVAAGSVNAHFFNYQRHVLGGQSQQVFLPFSDENSVPPVFRLKVTNTSTFNVLSYMYKKDYTVEHPTRAWIHVVGAEFEDEVLPVNGVISVTLPPGDYILSLEFDSIENPPAPPGKG